MSGQAMVTVHTTYDANEAEVIRIAVENLGVQCLLENEHQASFTGVMTIKIKVPEASAKEVSEFLDEHERRRVEQASDEGDEYEDATEVDDESDD